MFKKIKNSYLFQVLSTSWLICMVSHILVPTLIAFPIFSGLFPHNKHGSFYNAHHPHGLYDAMSEMMMFMIIIIPTSILISLIVEWVKRQKYHNETFACDKCPNKEDAFRFVQKHGHIDCNEDKCCH